MWLHLVKMFAVWGGGGLDKEWHAACQLYYGSLDERFIEFRSGSINTLLEIKISDLLYVCVCGRGVGASQPLPHHLMS